jgi:peptidoglycan hydrolase CwlO-like protein
MVNGINMSKVDELYSAINALYKENEELGYKIKDLEREIISPLENDIIKNRIKISDIRKQLRSFGERV